MKVGSMSLRHVLYHHMKLTKGYSLITEVHQESELDSVDIVIPDIPEAEAMVAMTNKNSRFTCQTVLLMLVWVRYL